jgi:hypothetical protein
MVVRIDIPKVSQDAIDEVVAEVTRKGSIGPKSSLLPLLTPWLLKITETEQFDVCTYTMSRNAFGDWMTDRDLCDHVAAKVRLEISDDMRLRHIRARIADHMEESDSPTCIQRITSRGGRSVAVVFVFTDFEPPAIERFLGAWLTPTAFWLEYSKKNVDLELPPSDEEILQQWERDGPDK